MITLDIDISDVKRAAKEAQDTQTAGLRRAVGVAARTGVAEAVTQKTYQDQTGRLSRTAKGRVTSARRDGAEAEMLWPAPYATFVDEDTKAHTITAKNGKVLAFAGSGGGTVFRRSVQHPGTTGHHFTEVATEAAQRTLDDEGAGIAAEIDRVLRH